MVNKKTMGDLWGEMMVRLKLNRIENQEPVQHVLDSFFRVTTWKLRTFLTGNDLGFRTGISRRACTRHGGR